MNIVGWEGRSTYNALQFALRGRLPNLGGVVKDWNMVASYSLGRLTGVSEDQATVRIYPAVNNDDLLGFSGPCALDGTHIVSIGSVFQVPGGNRRDRCR